ncbi:MAG TPA: zinc ribbon domain-containing protein [Thermoplasmatales archaeon]|nr:zinc ribbon domain-containing protein [Thermoplasmatales archaeon]
MAIICPICGEENPEGAATCRACGAPLEEPPAEKKGTSEKILIAIFVIALLVIAAIIVAPFLYNNGSGGNGGGTGLIPDWWWEKYGLEPGSSDPYEDLDGDGLYNLDEYRLGTNPLDPDTDGDGIIDSLDIIPLHDAGIQITIDTLRINDFVEGVRPVYKPTGQFFFLVYVDGSLAGQVPSTPAELKIDVEHAVGWSLTVNVPDDRHPTVRLELYAKKALGRNELLDINGQNNSKNPAGYYLEIPYHLGIRDVGRVQTGRSDGSDDGNRGLQDDKDALVTWTIKTIDMQTR